MMRIENDVLASAGEWNHVVQRFHAAFKETPDVASSLPNALLVLDHGDAHKTFAMLAEGDARRDHDARFLHHQRCKLHAADFPEQLWQRRPGEHRGGRWRNLPPGPAE